MSQSNAKPEKLLASKAAEPATWPDHWLRFLCSSDAEVRGRAVKHFQVGKVGIRSNRITSCFAKLACGAPNGLHAAFSWSTHLPCVMFDAEERNVAVLPVTPGVAIQEPCSALSQVRWAATTSPFGPVAGVQGRSGLSGAMTTAEVAQPASGTAKNRIAIYSMNLIF